MGLTINRPKPSIKTALADFAARPKKDKRVLMLIRHKDGAAYKVKTFDPATNKAVLYTGFKHQTITTTITDRECELYYPYLR